MWKKNKKIIIFNKFFKIKNKWLCFVARYSKVAQLYHHGWQWDFKLETSHLTLNTLTNSPYLKLD